MSRYKAYREYKESGVEMLGPLPTSWTTMQVRYLLRDGGEGIKIGPFGSALRLEDMVDSGVRVYGQENVIQRDFSLGTRRISAEKFSEMAVYEVACGDVLITMMGTSGKCILVPEDAEKGIIDSHLLRMRLSDKDIISAFFRLLIDESFEIENQIKISGKGSIMHGLNSGIVKSLKLPLPSIPEQISILNFLDHETAKIDALIEKQQRLIELLKEKRQAVISHAVTKGLNPNAPMKDSGVEWLGEVPAHWISTRLKYLKGLEPNSFVDGPFGSNLKSEHFIEDGVVYVIESTFATTGQLDTAQLKKISLQHYETIKRSTTKGGDIIIAKIGARYGSSSILPELDSKAVVSGNSLKLTVNESLLTNEFANDLLRVLKANDAMDDGVNITAQPALSLGGLNNLPFLRVPLSEQHGIVKFVKEQKEIFDGLIEKAALFIELSIERRTALISAAVTGKIDVRDWRAAA